MNRHSPILLALACLLAAPAAHAVDCDCEKKPPVVRKKPKKVQRVKVAAPALPPVAAPAPPPPNVVAVNLSAGTDNCIGSIDPRSNGLTDWNCVLLRKSAALANVGKPEAAVALLCADQNMRAALEQTGTSCDPEAMVEQKPTLDRSRGQALDLLVKR